MKPYLPAAALCAGVLLSACAEQAPPPVAAAPPPQPIVVADTSEAVYSVRAVNRRTRDIALNTPDDRVITIKAGPEVRNFNRIRVGDRVRVRFAEGVALAMAPPDSTPQPTEAVVGAARSGRGQLPGAAVGGRGTETVRIVSVDPATGRTTFIRPDGTTRSVTPQRPETLEFARGLRPGDMVTVTFGEGAAVQVLPAT
jgi:hypothetical protein